MQTYSATDAGPLTAEGYVDADDMPIISVLWGAPEYQNSTVYREGDIIRPTTDNGYVYTCSISGVTDVAEPASWSQTKQKSGMATFLASTYNLWVLPNEAITASSWVATNGVELIYSYFDDATTSVQVSYIPASITEFNLTNQIAKAPTGETLSRTFRYKVRAQ